jgi:hypothetical protein
MQNIDWNKIDDFIIMSIPTPNFIIDINIPSKLRDLLIEATKCLKENALVGASACIRKAIYEFLKKEKAIGNNYDEKIKSIKQNHEHIRDYLDIVKGIKGLTSSNLHENSDIFEELKSEDIKMYIQILEEIFKEIYVIPKQREERKQNILKKNNETITKGKEKNERIQKL